MDLIKSDSKLSYLFVLKVLSQLGRSCTSEPGSQHITRPLGTDNSRPGAHIRKSFWGENWVQSPISWEKKKKKLKEEITISTEDM